MRSFTLVLALLLSQLLPFSTVLAKPRKAYRAPTPSIADSVDVIAARQHHAPRALLDVCAYIGADIGLGIDLLGIDLNDLLDLQICLCLSALPLTLDANAQVKVLGDKYGMDLVNVVLRLLVRTVAPLPEQPSDLFARRSTRCRARSTARIPTTARRRASRLNLAASTANPHSSSRVTSACAPRRTSRATASASLPVP